jgi:GLPGLI family protein
MKIYISVILLLLSTILYAQDFQGQAYYFSKTSMDMNFGGREITPEMKKRIAERMKSAFEKTYILTFSKTTSTYKEEVQLGAPGTGGGRFGGMMSSFSSADYYKDVKAGMYYDQREFFGKNFLIKDSLPSLKWKMVNETKKIGNYTCFKAVATKKVSAADWRSMRPGPPRNAGNRERVSDSVRKVTDSISSPKEIEIVAWYTPEIPVNQGPAAYWGLPGLILEVQDDRTTLLCSKIILNAKEKEVLDIPSKGKEVSQEEFDAITKKKMEEMREQFGGRNRGRTRGQ